MWRLAWAASLFKETCPLTLMQVRGTTAWRAQHGRGQEYTLSSGTVVKWDHGPRAGGVGGVCVACDGVVVRVRGWLLGSALWDSRRLCFAPCSSSLNRCSSTANNHKTVHCRDRQSQVGCGVKCELSGHQHQVTGQDWHQLNSLGFHSVTFAYLDILPYGPNESSLHELSFWRACRILCVCWQYWHHFGTFSSSSSSSSFCPAFCPSVSLFFLSSPSSTSLCEWNSSTGDIPV